MYQYDDPTVTAILPASTGNGTPGYFTDGNPAGGQAATILRAEFMNMLMMELVNAITGAGIPLSKSTFTQLKSAIEAYITARTATETAPGIVELADVAEAQALASAVVALTPARLADAFKGANQSLSANGYQKLPGGLIIQWGALNTTATNGTVTFPTAFPNACFSVVAHDYATTVSDNSIVRFNLPTNTQVSWLAQTYTGSSVSPNTWTWIAIGY